MFPQISRSRNPDDQLVALPLVLPIGWINSSPMFSTATEMVADIINAITHSNEAHRHHLLEHLATKLDETLVSTSLPDTMHANSSAPQSAPLVETLEPSLDDTSNQEHPPRNTSLHCKVIVKKFAT